MTAFSVQAIANYFIRQGREDQNPITHMKVQKLSYIAHGWCLALMERPLISDPVEAWEYGPVYSSLYQELKEYGRNPIQEEIKTLVFSEDSLDWTVASIEKECDDEIELSETRELLDKIWEVYKPYEALQLSMMTHEEGTPWYTVNSKYPQARNRRIPNTLIETHFRMKAEK